jgi:hypothetical protein
MIQRRTVIDYAIFSKSLYPKIIGFNVIPREPDFDHPALAVQLEVDPALSVNGQPSKGLKI